MRISISIPISVAILSFLSSGACQAQDPSAEKAREVLSKQCRVCHGAGGTIEGGFAAVLDRTLLVERKLVVAGDPDKSPLVSRLEPHGSAVAAGAGQVRWPSVEEKAALKNWIARGPTPLERPSPVRTPLTLPALYRMVWTDMIAATERDRRFFRYFTFDPQQHAGVSDDERLVFRVGLAKLLNSLSWSPDIVMPRPVDKDATVFRIDLRDYRWSQKTWRLLTAGYSHFVEIDTVEAKHCLEATGGAPPVVRADWFALHAGQAPLYQQILDLPAFEGELERELQVDVPDNLRSGLAIRAGFRKSGETPYPRLIERHETVFGAMWKTHDLNPVLRVEVVKKSGSSTMRSHENRVMENFEHLTSLQPRSFDGKASHEVLFDLPNGLLAFAAFDELGHRRDSVSPLHGRDPRSSAPIRVGLGCMSCHASGVVHHADEMRDQLRAIDPKTTFAEERDLLKSLHVTDERLVRVMSDDSDRTSKAVAKLGVAAMTADPIVALAARYAADLDLRQTAAELGTTPESLTKLAASKPILGKTLAILREKGSIPRSAFPHREIAQELGLGKVRPFAVVSTEWFAPDHSHLLPAKESPAPLVPLALNNPRPRLPTPMPTDAGPQEDFTHSRVKDHWFSEFPNLKLATESPRAVAHSPTDRWVAVECRADAILVFDPTTGEKRSLLVGHDGRVVSLAFSPDGTILAAATNRSLHWWDAQTGRSLGSAPVPASLVRFRPGGKQLLSAVGPKVRVVDLATGKEQAEQIPAGRVSIADLAISPSGKFLAVGRDKVEVWQLDGSKLVASLTVPNLPSFPRFRLAFSPDEKQIAAGTSDGTLAVWDVATQRLVKHFRDSGQAISGVAFLPGGKEILIGEESFADSKTPTGRAARWNLESEVLVQSYVGHLSGPSSLALSGDGSRFATIGEDRSLRYWDVAGAPQVASRVTPLSSTPTPVAPTSDPAQPRVLRDRFEHPKNVTCLAISVDAAWVVTGCEDNLVRVWRLDRGTLVKEFAGHTGPILDVAISEDRKTITSCSSDQSIRRWDFATGNVLLKMESKGPTLRSMAASVDGRVLVIGTDTTIELVNFATKARKTLTFKVGGPRRVGLTPDGKRLILTRDADRFEVLNADSGELIRSFAGHAGKVTAAAFVPDGKHVASAATDKTVRVWEVETGRQVHSMDAVSPDIVDVAISPGLRHVFAAASETKTLRFASGKTVTQLKFAGILAFDGGTGATLRPWDGFDLPATRLAVAGDSSQVVIAIGNHLATRSLLEWLPPSKK